MKKLTYLSKKSGPITIRSEQNHLTIQTKRLKLQSINQIESESLIAAYTKLLTDPQNVAMFENGQPWDSERIRDYVTSETAQWDEGNLFGIFAVYDIEHEQFIGTLGIKFVPNEYKNLGHGHVNVAELSYVLDQSSWGQGYGTEIAIAGKKYIRCIREELTPKAIDSVPTEIVATVDPSNTGSKRILEKILKHQEDTLLIKFDGKPRVLFFKPLPIHPESSETSPMLLAKL